MNKLFNSPILMFIFEAIIFSGITGYDSASTFPVSLYATKGTIVSTRADQGIYNLIVYEWR